MSDKELDALILALHDFMNGDAAAIAASRLHKEATVENTERLLGLLTDDDFFVREAAVWPVTELAGPSALRSLLVAYQRGLDDGHDNDGFTTALIEMAQMNKAGCHEVLQELAQEADLAIRENATWLLEFCSTTDAP